MKKRDRNRKKQKARDNTRGRKDPKTFIGYEDIVKENEAFEKYYKAQNIVPDEEWDLFMATLREHLPVTFRITGSKSHAKCLLKIIRSEYFSQLLNTSENSANEEKPFCLPWYPDELAWQLNLSRKCIRKSEAYLKLHNFLIYETNGGYISRQESVSMIPPLLLDVQSHHKILDMCAAPGSKTAQLIEMLHARDDSIPEGFLIANDVDNKRCYMLVHQAKRLHSPCFIISNHDASSMPNIRVKRNNGEIGNLKFDRILCDVPCSGDGTLRKNYDVWPKWNAANGNNFHGIQSRIGKRGLELLEVGGLLVYSTCSLNPMEDEAVIHHLLVESKGTVELVDVSTKLPGLKFRQGLSHWKVMNRELTQFEKFEDVPEKFSTQIRPHMFPPSPEEADKFNLHRCLRILPHHQNTGGFFVAVLRKTAPLPGEKLDSIKASASDDTQENNGRSSPPRKKFKVYGFREDPFFFFDENEEVWPPIREFYGIDSKFKSTCLLTRCQTGKKRNIYLVSEAIKEIVVNNTDRIKIINTGMKMFSRNENKGATCGFRLTQEGIHIMLPYIKSRRVHITQNDLVLLLTNDYPPNSKMSDETKQQFQLLDSGCVILIYQMDQLDDNPDPLSLVLCGWKGATSIRAYIPKSEQIHYLRLCGVDTSKYERNRYKNSSTSANEEQPAPDEMENADENSTISLEEQDKIEAIPQS